MGRTPPDAFVYRAGMSADEIPVERVTPRELGVTEPPRRSEYTKVPSAFYSRFQPADRLLLCLIFARDVFGEDAQAAGQNLGPALRGASASLTGTSADVRWKRWSGAILLRYAVGKVPAHFYASRPIRNERRRSRQRARSLPSAPAWRQVCWTRVRTPSSVGDLVLGGKN